MATIKNFTDLIAWQKSHELVLEVYKKSQKFPVEEKFGLTNQVRRAAVSITSNLAEGFGRNSAKDKCQFYCIARTSSLEVQSQLYIARDLGYIIELDFFVLESKCLEVGRLISGLEKTAASR